MFARCNKTIEKEPTTEKKKHKLPDINKVILRLTDDLIDIDQRRPDKDNESKDQNKKLDKDSEVMDQKKKRVKDNESVDQKRNSCWQKLFLYSVLNGFDEMADYFWERGQEAIPAALTASKLYNCLASLKQNESDQWKERMEKNATKYEDWAYDILTRCHDDRRFAKKMRPCDLLTRVLPNWGNITCLNLADSNDNLKFYSHPVIKDLLDDKWHSGIVGFTMMPSRWRPWNLILEPMMLMLCSVFPFLIPFWVTFRKDDDNSKPCFLRQIWAYYKAPTTIFRQNVVSQILFIILFSYNLIWGEFILTPRRWSLFDRLLFAWVLSMLFEELRQMIEWEAHTFVLRLEGWWSDHWNKIDIVTQLLFVLGTFLRYSTDPVVVENARIILAFDLFIFYVRLLEYLTFVKRIGPKVFMIGRMFVDLGFFVCILFVVLLGYGITVHIILYPQTTHPKTVFESVIYRPYFQIFGELFLEEITATPEDGSCSFNSTALALGALPCAKHPRIGSVLLAFYLAFSHVLLLNMLIAMFRYLFYLVHLVPIERLSTPLSWFIAARKETTD
ncbi:transient receptor potential cation channel subfamily M member 5-like [Amphiura filiformis]|uniref:transient receptor potential cation channel subfamily M member 5-like n=1 Tax=Amphiura filiformis TaxID=82378 RepID=UPI003B223A52